MPRRSKHEERRELDSRAPSRKLVPAPVREPLDSTQFDRMAWPLPLRAMYPIGELARATGMSHRRLDGLLRGAGVQILRSGSARYVPLSELEAKVRPLWDSIKAAEALRQEFRHARNDD